MHCCAQQGESEVNCRQRCICEDYELFRWQGLKGALTLNTLIETEPGVRPLLLLGSLGGASAGSAVTGKALQVSLKATRQLLCDAQAPAARVELLAGCTPRGVRRGVAAATSPPPGQLQKPCS